MYRFLRNNLPTCDCDLFPPIGTQYKKITVIGWGRNPTKVLRNGIERTHNHLTLKIKCECGKEKYVSLYDFKAGKIASCGCFKSEIMNDIRRHNKEEDRERQILYREYSHIRKRNRQKGFKDIFSFDYYRKIAIGKCYYCGAEPSRVLLDREHSRGKDIYTSSTTVIVNGIDRKDSEKGYTEDNSVACCPTCNFAKHTLSEQEFKEWIIRIYKNYIEKSR